MRRAAAFFALTFAWSWILWLAAAATGRGWSSFPTVVLSALGGIGPVVVATLRAQEKAMFLRRVVDPRGIGLAWWLAIAAVAVLPFAIGRPFGRAGDEGLAPRSCWWPSSPGSPRSRAGAVRPRTHSIGGCRSCSRGSSSASLGRSGICPCS